MSGSKKVFRAPVQDRTLSEFSSLVRQARQESGLSLTEVSERSGLSRATIFRWEHGHHLAWLPELERFLEATQASERLSGSLMRAVNRPRMLEQLASHGGPRFGMNSLLRTLRLRSEMSVETVAHQVGVSSSAVRQWERGDSWPSPERLHQFCYLVGATPEELTALSHGPIVPHDEAIQSLKVVEEQLAAGGHPFSIMGADPLLDLKVAFYEHTLVHRVRRGVRVEDTLRTLSKVRAFYAQKLELWGRHEEAILVASRNLNKECLQIAPDPYYRSHIVIAQVSTKRKRTPLKLAETLVGLEHDIAQNRVHLHFSFRPWIWATVADLLVEGKRARLALEALDRAEKSEQQYQDPTAEFMRRRAKLLNKLNRSSEAEHSALSGIDLAQARRSEPALPSLWIEVATARLQMHRHQDAIDALMSAKSLATENRIDFLLPEIAKRLA